MNIVQQATTLPMALQVGPILKKLCRLTVRRCIRAIATTASNMLDDTLAIRKRLCCLLRICVETVVSNLFW